MYFIQLIFVENSPKNITSYMDEKKKESLVYTNQGYIRYLGRVLIISTQSKHKSMRVLY